MLVYVGSVTGYGKIRLKFLNILEFIFASIMAQQPLVDQRLLINVA
jgi:hypothetical protein